MKVLRTTMPDGSMWDVPVDVIARDRAAYYAEREYGGDIEKSLADDTLPLFAEDTYQVEDWAADNMNWQDVAHLAKKVTDRPAMSAADFQEGWCNGDKEVLDVPDPSELRASLEEATKDLEAERDAVSVGIISLAAAGNVEAIKATGEMGLELTFRLEFLRGLATISSSDLAREYRIRLTNVRSQFDLAYDQFRGAALKKDWPAAFKCMARMRNLLVVQAELLAILGAGGGDGST